MSNFKPKTDVILPTEKFIGIVQEDKKYLVTLLEVNSKNHVAKRQVLVETDSLLEARNRFNMELVKQNIIRLSQ
jgi:hypothetical protein